MTDDQPLEAEHAPQRIQPLTRHNASGVEYQRDADVQDQILTGLQVPPETLVNHAHISDSTASGYLKEESLVYFLRAYRRWGREDIVSALASVLVQRSAANMNTWFRALEIEAREDAAQEVWRQLFEQVLDLESDRGDFFQVRFWPGLERLAIGVFRDFARVRMRSRSEVSIDQLAGSVSGTDDEPQEAIDHTQILEFEVTIEQRALSQDALSQLPEPQRTAFILRYFYSWPVEHHNPNVPTISRYFGKTDRTIRNWLKQAEAVLEQWRGAHE